MLHTCTPDTNNTALSQRYTHQCPCLYTACTPLAARGFFYRGCAQRFQPHSEGGDKWEIRVRTCALLPMIARWRSGDPTAIHSNGKASFLSFSTSRGPGVLDNVLPGKNHYARQPGRECREGNPAFLYLAFMCPEIRTLDSKPRLSAWIPNGWQPYLHQTYSSSVRVS